MDSTVEVCNKVGKDDSHCKINCFEDLEFNNNNKQLGATAGGNMNQK